MKSFITTVVTSAIVAVITVVLVGGNQSAPLGGRTNYDTVQASGLVIGTTTASSNFSFLKAGACVLGILGPSSIDASHAATTTKVYDCAVSGVNASDTVIASISTSTVSGSGGWVVAFTKASSTPGFIEVGVANLTGAAAVPSAQSVGSSTFYSIFRTQTSDQGL